MIWVIIIILIVSLDQLTKYLISRNVDYGVKLPIIDRFFYITYHENKGAAWGIFQNGRIFLIAMTIITSIILIYVMIKNDNKLLRLSLSFILGGALGNLIDRALKGGVPDFLDFYIWSYHFPTFNVADIFIVIGTALLMFLLLFVYKEASME